ncbi:hypothetical protein Q0M34_14110 [Staphylococcus aureus]|nr:hypothetical protein [Staphylococcus aureus]
MTKRASPTAASHAANTRRITGRIKDKKLWKFKTVKVIRMNIDNIIPSKHKRDDIRWDR